MADRGCAESLGLHNLEVNDFEKPLKTIASRLAGGTGAQSIGSMNSAFLLGSELNLNRLRRCIIDAYYENHSCFKRFSSYHNASSAIADDAFHAVLGRLELRTANSNLRHFPSYFPCPLPLH